METYQFWTIIGVLITLFLAIFAGFGWLIHRVDCLDKRISSKMEGIGNRLIELETEMRSMKDRLFHLDGMMQTIVCFMLGNRTGTEK